MGNEKYSLTKEITRKVEKLPYFTVENLKIIGAPPYQIRIALSRMEKRGVIIRLKKGFYTSRKFIENAKMNGMSTPFMEYMASKLYMPSYLSLDYVLYENNLLTEVPVGFTLITRKKTFSISNGLGRFIYRKIKDELYYGYGAVKSSGYIYFKADKAKALFDFLYLRKNTIRNRDMAEELRLNLEALDKFGIKRLKGYVGREGSTRMGEIFNFLFEYV
jgi:predicted transcriptional regulator of viral defense system